MSKHQTRRSLSFERRLHEITTQHAAALKQSTSHYVSELIRRDLIAAGIEVPAAPLHVVIDDERVGRWWCKAVRAAWRELRCDARRRCLPSTPPLLERLAALVAERDTLCAHTNVGQGTVRAGAACPLFELVSMLFGRCGGAIVVITPTPERPAPTLRLRCHRGDREAGRRRARKEAEPERNADHACSVQRAVTSRRARTRAGEAPASYRRRIHRHA